MKKGFTLIELLIVIAILAILATVVVLVLNPAQMLAQARDTQRISDLTSVRSAIGLYLATAASPSLGAVGTQMITGGPCPFTAACTNVSSSLAVDGSGWVGINLNNTVGSSTIASLPQDPTNSVTYQYYYIGDNTNKVFELAGRLESTKYEGNMTTDGGKKNTCGTDFGTSTTSSTCFYETGSSLSL